MKHKNTKPYTISNLKHLSESGKIRIPDYQREKVWSLYQKQLLLDSLIRDIDIPKLYFSMKT